MGPYIIGVKIGNKEISFRYDTSKCRDKVLEDILKKFEMKPDEADEYIEIYKINEVKNENKTKYYLSKEAIDFLQKMSREVSKNKR